LQPRHFTNLGSINAATERGTEGAETQGGKESMTAGFLAIAGLVAVVLLYRMVDSYFKDKRND
jgi:hypothetical protein